MSALPRPRATCWTASPSSARTSCTSPATATKTSSSSSTTPTHRTRARSSRRERSHARSPRPTIRRCSCCSTPANPPRRSINSSQRSCRSPSAWPTTSTTATPSTTPPSSTPPSRTASRYARRICPDRPRWRWPASTAPSSRPSPQPPMSTPEPRSWSSPPTDHISDAAGERQRGGGEGLGLLADEEAGFAGGLDRGLFDRGDRGIELFDGGGGDGDQTGVAEHAVTGGEVGFLPEHVLVFGGLGGVLDLPDLRPLRLVRDVLDLLLADVADGLVGAQRGAQQRDRPLDTRGQGDRGEEPGVDHRSGPFADPEHAVVAGVGAQSRPGLGDGDRAGSGEVLPELPVPLQRGADRRVIGGAQHDRELTGAQPSGRGEVRGPQRGGQGRHLLAEHVRRALDAAAGGADLPGRGPHVQAQRETGRVAFPGGAGSLDELAVGGGGPGVVVSAVLGPPFRRSEEHTSELQSRGHLVCRLL